MKRLLLMFVIAIAGCGGMSDQQIRDAGARCQNEGGQPVSTAGRDGSVQEVRCL